MYFGMKIFYVYELSIGDNKHTNRAQQQTKLRESESGCGEDEMTDIRAIHDAVEPNPQLTTKSHEQHIQHDCIKIGNGSDLLQA